MNEDLKKSVWLWLIKNGYRNDFAGKITLVFAGGGLRDVTPKPINEFKKPPRRLLPSKDYTGTIVLDCAVFSAGLVVTLK
ncbi:MAG: hypothetical protein PHF56_00325 [Desulfuromonadaceae bacterium]|nr:hypothetical protein [Desulfuromonadaceae bacterium]